jgi:hypothetical protein
MDFVVVVSFFHGIESIELNTLVVLYFFSRVRFTAGNRTTDRSPGGSAHKYYTASI